MALVGCPITSASASRFQCASPGALCGALDPFDRGGVHADQLGEVGPGEMGACSIPAEQPPEGI